MRTLQLFILLFLLIAGYLPAQVKLDPEGKESGFLKRFNINSPLTLDLNEETGEEGEEKEKKEPVELRVKKRKKKTFYDIKTKRRFTKKGYGKRVTIELFHILKQPEEPDPYVRDIYWYDAQKRKIRIGGKIDQKYGALLHGTYEKMVGDQIVEKGLFYKGVKNGRWIKTDKNDLLVDKEKYFFGWPKESLVSYYDSERKKMKEIIPIEYGEKEGNYFYFFESGKVGVVGEYKWDERVGDWTEYYPKGGRKKIIRYPKNPYDKDTTPFTLKEWDKRGRMVYERK